MASVAPGPIEWGIPVKINGLKLNNNTVIYNNKIVWPQWIETGTTATNSYVITNTWNNWVVTSAANSITATGGFYRGLETNVTHINTVGPDENGAFYEVVEAVPEDRLQARSAEVMAQRQREQVAREEEYQRQCRAYQDERQRERERLSRRRLEETAKLEKAQDRGMQLLYTVMSPAQIQQFEENRMVRVPALDGGYYVIDMNRSRGVHGNIDKYDEHGCYLGRACVAPQMYIAGGALPIADGWVGQLLGLQCNEEEFLRVANWSQRRVCEKGMKRGVGRGPRIRIRPDRIAA